MFDTNPAIKRSETCSGTGAHTLTGAFGGLGGGQGDSAQAEQFEEGGGLLVELTQLSLCPRQVHTAERENKYQAGQRILLEYISDV